MMDTSKLSNKARELYENPDYIFTILREGENAGCMAINMLKKTDHAEFLAKHEAEALEIKAMLLEKLEEEREAIRKANEEYETRMEKIASIEGLSEIKTLRRKVANWHAEFNRQADSEDGVTCMPAYPTETVEELNAKYPRAAAYLMAEAWAESENYTKSKLGQTAADAIIEGGNYEQAISGMETEWKAYVAEHMWD